MEGQQPDNIQLEKVEVIEKKQRKQRKKKLPNSSSINKDEPHIQEEILKHKKPHPSKLNS